MDPKRVNLDASKRKNSVELSQLGQHENSTGREKSPSMQLSERRKKREGILKSRKKKGQGRKRSQIFQHPTQRQGGGSSEDGWCVQSDFRKYNGEKERGGLYKNRRHR